ncbi:MAG: hypothetical protein ACOCNX_00650 [Prevotella sp.]
MAKNNNAEVEIRLNFPNIDKDFTYEYVNADMWTNYVEDAMQQFFENTAPILFALYGYAPMDVTIIRDGYKVGFLAMCYQETFWHVYFAEGGEPWHGRFSQFTDALIETRYRKEHQAIAA